MTYKVGISSGFWNIGKDPTLLGLAQKAGGFGATGGVQFNQVDLETAAEFLEPRLKENLKRVKKELSIEVGLHGEIGELSAFESGERIMWEQCHDRLVETVMRAADLGFVYINYHLSTKPLLVTEEQRIRPFGFQYQVVTPEGKPFHTIADKYSAVKDFIKGALGRAGQEIQQEKQFREKVNEIENRYTKELTKRTDEALKKLRESEGYKNMPPPVQKEAEEEQKRIVHNEVNKEADAEIRDLTRNADQVYEFWKKSEFAQYILDAGEIDAYIATAYMMKQTGDPLWFNIVGNEDPEKAYTKSSETHNNFNAAVAARYIQGHLEVKDHPTNIKFLKGMSVKEWITEKKIMVLFENPEAGQGREGLYRLFHPSHAYQFIKKINCPFVKLCIDFEHMMAQRLDPEKVLKALPGDFGKTVFLLHLGEPKPYFGTAHIPFQLGSQAQEIIYKWIYELRKKGFDHGYMLFERGGGRKPGNTSAENVFEHSVFVLRQIAKYLDKDTSPESLPPEFYGISTANPETWPRQLVTIREHAYDPLKDLMTIPEEQHSFLSKAAVDKGKREEWSRRQLR